MKVVADQLLGCRQLSPVGHRASEYLLGKRVLVTGAAGSIGSEIVRQLFQLTGELPYLVDVDESRMHSLQLSVTATVSSAVIASCSPTSATVNAWSACSARSARMSSSTRRRTST